MSERLAVKWGLVSLGAGLALTLASGPSFAQDNGKPAAAPATPPAGAPSAAAPATSATGAPSAATIAHGKDLFDNYGCGGCHSLSDDGATGHVGPSLDGDANLTPDFIIDRVTNGSGPMPSFMGQMSADDIAALAAYVMSAKK